MLHCLGVCFHTLPLPPLPGVVSMLLLLLLSISSHLSRSTRSVILPLCMVCLLVGDVLLFVCKVYLHAVEHERAAASIVA